MFIGNRPLVELHPVEAFEAAGEGDETEARGEHFVLDYGGIVVDEDVFDCEGGDFGDEDPAEGIGYGGVKGEEGECGFVGRVLVELDSEILGTEG